MVNKALKLTDAGIQVLLYVCFAVKACADDDPSFELLLIAYFTIGAYQVISCVAQLPYKGQPVLRARKFYQKILLGTVVAGLIMLPIFILYLYALLFLSPLIAFFYTGLSFYETKKFVCNEK